MRILKVERQKQGRHSGPLGKAHVTVEIDLFDDREPQAEAQWITLLRQAIKTVSKN